jgi:hypothetical protein
VRSSRRAACASFCSTVDVCRRLTNVSYSSAGLYRGMVPTRKCHCSPSDRLSLMTLDYSASDVCARAARVHAIGLTSPQTAGRSEHVRGVRAQSRCVILSLPHIKRHLLTAPQNGCSRTPVREVDLAVSVLDVLYAANLYGFDITLTVRAELDADPVPSRV